MKIDLLCSSNQYGTAWQFLQGMYAALQRAGVTCRLLDFDPQFLREHLLTLHYDPPDMTFSFGTVSIGSRQRLCDTVGIPHFSYLLDLAGYYVPHLQSPYSLASCIDRSDLEFLERLQVKNALFLPHATHAGARGLAGERPYDVAFVGTAVDLEALVRGWKKDYGDKVAMVLEGVGKAILLQRAVPTPRILLEGLERGGVALGESFLFSHALRAVEDYARGKDRFEMLRAIRSFPVHVFGGAGNGRGWQELLGGQDNIVVHGALDYSATLEVMQKSRVVLNSAPTLKFGLHERIVDGLAAGALVVAEDLPYVGEAFLAGEEIVLRPCGMWEGLDESVASLLEGEARRNEMALAGRAKVLSAHTWDHRAATLLEKVPQLLEKAR